MTDSDTLTGRPPDAPPPGEEWKPMPGAKDWYEFSHRGYARSLDHTTAGRPYKGQVLNPRRDGDGYAVINITMADGTRKHGVSLARCILLAHAGEPPDPGMQACHGPGGQLDNRWPENLRWDTDDANRIEALELRLANNPPKPKPLKECVRCGAGFDTPGRRCRPCVIWFGVEGAKAIAAGKRLEAAAEELDYPSATGLFELARKHGGLRCTVEPVVLIDEANAALRAARAVGDSASWLRRVTMATRKRGNTP